MFTSWKLVLLFTKKKKLCVNVLLTRVRETIVCSGKAISTITCSECVSVGLVIQHAKFMRRITLSSVVCSAALYFSTGSHKRHGFREEKFIEHEMLVFISLQFYPKHYSKKN